MFVNFNQSVIYHVYPKSFCDSNGDFIGDIQGLIQKLHFLKLLGVDIILMTPIFKSGGIDGGYDVIDYNEIEECYGSLGDLQELISEARKLNMEIMLDIVLNHVSCKNKMFQKAVNGDKYYQDFFFFMENSKDMLPLSKFESIFGGSAWEYVPSINKFYFHAFAIGQADLNYDNIEVIKWAQNVLKFWKALGVKCFRLDAICHISKGNFNQNYSSEEGYIPMDGPKVHEYIRAILNGAFSKNEEHFIMGEVGSTDNAQIALYVGKDKEELDSVYHFTLHEINSKGIKWDFSEKYFMSSKNRMSEFFSAMQRYDAKVVNAFESHDFSRGVSRILNDTKYRYESATTLLAVQMFLPGITSIYQGQEIGMTNVRFSSLDMFDDVECKNLIKILSSEGVSDKEILNVLNKSSRDNSRTTMQWDNSENGGFSTGNAKTAKAYSILGTPIVTPPKTNPNYKEINFEDDIKREKSVFNFTKQIITLRKKLKVIECGNFEMVLKDEPKVLAYKREFESHSLVVISNFFKDQVKVNYNLVDYKVIVNNYKEQFLNDIIILKPYQTIIFYK